MAWNATLAIDYARHADQTVAHFRHSGPLRILQSLYPEGPGICHNVLVHPPGGLVGGDALDLSLTAKTGAHGLITTPGATRFYRSTGEQALQTTRLSLESGARFEWLPQEAICYSGCLAQNRLILNLAPGAELMGWDVTAFGLPAANQPFERGQFCQHIEMPGVWLERARIEAADARLWHSPLGLAGQRCIASLFFVAGRPLERARREQALEAARVVLEAHPLCAHAGVSSLHGQVIVVRVLAPLVEPAIGLLKQIWQVWRAQLWQLSAVPPRIWAM